MSVVFSRLRARFLLGQLSLGSTLGTRLVGAWDLRIGVGTASEEGDGGEELTRVRHTAQQALVLGCRSGEGQAAKQLAITYFARVVLVQPELNTESRYLHHIPCVCPAFGL